MISWLPTPALALAFLFGFLTVPLLLLLARGPWRIVAEGRRFVLASVLAGSGWLLALIVLARCGYAAGGHELLAGALVLLTGFMAFWILWSILCWGFTTSLLIALVGADAAVDRDTWFRTYGGGSSIDGFAADRLSILLATGLARETDGAVILNRGFALPLARMIRALRRTHGVGHD